jgi:hypothetical protein
MSPERNNHHRITLSEIITHTVHGSMIPNLIRPVISAEFAPDQSFAREFTSAFLYVLLIEGEIALDYIGNLSDKDKENVLRILDFGGIGDTEFLSNNKGGGTQIRNIIENNKFTE